MRPEPKICVFRYRAADRPRWNEAIARSVNGVFLHRREYMDYHGASLQDHSLLFSASGRLVALLPGHVRDDAYCSHEGLTFGGLIVDDRARLPLVLDIFDALVDYLRALGVRRLFYRASPPIYHATPAQADLYALVRHGGRLVRRDVASVIARATLLPYSKAKRHSVARGRSRGVRIERGYDFAPFMSTVADLLERKYDAAPTHTADQMVSLARLFPDNIKLVIASKDDRMVAGAIVYESPRVARLQYLASTEQGCALGAVDLLVDGLLTDVYCDKPYVDFGTSMLGSGRDINASLLRSKEGYGARTVVYDSYEIVL